MIESQYSNIDLNTRTNYTLTDCSINVWYETNFWIIIIACTSYICDYFNILLAINLVNFIKKIFILLPRDWLVTSSLAGYKKYYMKILWYSDIKGERNQLMIWGFTEFRTNINKKNEDITFLMKILQGLMLKHIYIL